MLGLIIVLAFKVDMPCAVGPGWGRAVAWRSILGDADDAMLVNLPFGVLQQSSGMRRNGVPQSRWRVRNGSVSICRVTPVITKPMARASVKARINSSPNMP